MNNRIRIICTLLLFVGVIGPFELKSAASLAADRATDTESGLSSVRRRILIKYVSGIRGVNTIELIGQPTVDAPGVYLIQEDLQSKTVPGWIIYGNNSNTSDVKGPSTPASGTRASSANHQIGNDRELRRELTIKIHIANGEGNDESPMLVLTLSDSEAGNVYDPSNKPDFYTKADEFVLRTTLLLLLILGVLKILRHAISDVLK